MIPTHCQRELAADFFAGSKTGLLVFCAVALAMVAGCGPPLPAAKPRADFTPAETRGYRLFQTRCAGCHFAASEKPLHGPGLRGLYKKRYLPSGAPANDDRVGWVIEHGRNLMPAFGNNLDERQLEDLLAYLHTL